ncbi:MAG TPA: acyl-CoA dehydrogenase family protein [Stellaceae bacterium]|nr:acyl-CoA dehydrogenase family protein [Stellaceae bacterium]
MEFALSATQTAVQDAVLRICARFDGDYWLARDKDGIFPHDFHRAFAADGWLGICIPEAYGGAGLGLAEAAVMMQAVAQSGAAMAGASSLHMNIFGLNPVVRFGNDAQKRRMLPPLVAGQEKACFAVTEPNAGLDTGAIETRAVRRGTKYVLNGAKIWISTAQVAEKMLILARTAPRDAAVRTAGLSLFYTTLDRRFVEVREIGKMGRKAVDSNQLFIDGLEVPEEDRIGEEGRGFDYILHGLNPERVLVAAEAVGIGRVALERAASYAKERVVFGRPIGQNQGVQHPLARAWIELEAAELAMHQAAWRYDNGLSCGAQANAAKYLASEAAVAACETAMLTLGGYGYAKEYHVERYLREAMITRLAPVTPQLILSYIAERVLALPKSY